MAQGELKQLRSKLQQQQKQFQNFREECKNLQNFLESEVNKKQAEIRKLKEQAINKDRTFKSLKTQNSALLSEVTILKGELAKFSIGQQKNNEILKKLELMEKNNQELEEKNSKLAAELEKIKLEKSEKEEEIERYQQKNTQLQNKAIEKQHEISDLKAKIIECQDNLKIQMEKFRQLQNKRVKMEDLPTPHKQIKEDRFMTAKKSKKRQDSQLAQEGLKKYEQKLLRYQRQIRQLKERLAQQKQTSGQKPKEQQQLCLRPLKLYIACHVVTKQYYLSPIVEVIDQAKSIKLFKSSRNGCFDKSLGASRHKFDAVSHESNSIVKQVTQKIIKSEQCSHSILIYGVKKSNKKQIMGSILTKLFNFLKNKLENCSSQDLEAIFMKRIPDQQNSLVKEAAYSTDEILDILQKVSNIANTQLKKPEKSPSRRVQKPRVFYFSLHVDNFSLQISTSSFTNIPYRQKQVLSTFYNNVLYSKLSDILQPAQSQRYIILTLNPIVDLYQDCKNTLSVTQYKAILSSSKDLQINFEGSNKEILNDLVRKKMEGYEKEIEQNSLKIKKIQDECNYFKSKFDQLENRLKNLISTHHGQSSYLKKSPILLSYEKMLKFVHAVQAKNPIPIDNICSTMRFNAIDFNLNDSQDQNDVL